MVGEEMWILITASCTSSMVAHEFVIVWQKGEWHFKCAAYSAGSDFSCRLDSVRYIMHI